MFDEYLIPLYLIYRMNGEIRGRTRVQKLIFLAKEELKQRNLNINIRFTAWAYGPFSRDLMDALKIQVKEGVLLESCEESPWGIVYVYRLTENGRELIESALERGLLEKEVREKVDEIVDKYGSMPLPQLISKIYNEYSEYTPEQAFLY